MKKLMFFSGLGLVIMFMLTTSVYAGASLEKLWGNELKKVKDPVDALTDFTPILRKFDKCEADYTKYMKKNKAYRSKSDDAWNNAKLLANSIPKDLKKMHKQKGAMKKLTNDVRAFNNTFGDLDEGNLYKLDMKKVAKHWDGLVERMVAAKVDKNIRKNAKKALKRYTEVAKYDGKLDKVGQKLSTATGCLGKVEMDFKKAKKNSRKSAWGMKKKQKDHLRKVLDTIEKKIEQGDE